MNINEYKMQLAKECEILAATAKASDTKAKLSRSVDDAKQAADDLAKTQGYAIKIQGLTLLQRIGFKTFDELKTLMPHQNIEIKKAETKPAKIKKGGK